MSWGGFSFSYLLYIIFFIPPWLWFVIVTVLLTRTLEEGPGQGPGLRWQGPGPGPGLGCQGPGQGQGLEFVITQNAK